MFTITVKFSQRIVEFTSSRGPSQMMDNVYLLGNVVLKVTNCLYIYIYSHEIHTVVWGIPKKEGKHKKN